MTIHTVRNPQNKDTEKQRETLTPELPNELHHPEASSETLTPTPTPLDISTETFHEIWTLRICHPATNRMELASETHNPDSFGAIIRFEAQLSTQILRRVSRVIVSTFEKTSSGEFRKNYLVSSGDLSDFLSLSDSTIKMRDCELFENESEKNLESKNGSRGEIRTRGKFLKWLINWNNTSNENTPLPSQEWSIGTPGGKTGPLDAIASTLSGISGFEWKRLKNLSKITTSFESEEFSDSSIEKKVLSDGFGVLHQIDLPPRCRGWSWASGVDYKQRGNWEILTLEPQGPLAIPSSRTFLKIELKEPLDKEDTATNFEFFPVRNFLKVRSHPSLTHWQFSAEKGDWRIVGEVRSEILEFVGDTFETSNGETRFRCSSTFSSSQLTFYKKGKLQLQLDNRGSTFFEIVSPEKMKYVHFQI